MTGVLIEVQASGLQVVESRWYRRIDKDEEPPGISHITQVMGGKGFSVEHQWVNGVEHMMVSKKHTVDR